VVPADADAAPSAPTSASAIAATATTTARRTARRWGGRRARAARAPATGAPAARSLAPAEGGSWCPPLAGNALNRTSGRWQAGARAARPSDAQARRLTRRMRQRAVQRLAIDPSRAMAPGDNLHPTCDFRRAAIHPPL